jgi:hypothetical protein
MKRFLICALLVVNAMSAKTPEASWCKGSAYVNCGNLTWITDAIGATTEAKNEATRTKKLQEEEAAANEKAKNSRLLKQDILISQIDTTCTQSEQNIQVLRERTAKEKEAIENELRLKTELLVAKLNACEQADLKACDDAAELNKNIADVRGYEVNRLIAQNNVAAKREAAHQVLHQVKEDLPALYAAFSETQEKQTVAEKQVTQEFVSELKKLDAAFNAKLEEIQALEEKARAECFGNDENSNELGDASKETFSKIQDAKLALENNYEKEKLDLKAKYDGIKQAELDPIFAEREAKKVQLVDKQLAVIAYRKTLESLEDIEAIEKNYPRTRTVPMEVEEVVVATPAVETAPVVTPVATPVSEVRSAQPSSSWFGGWFGSSETTPATKPASAAETTSVEAQVETPVVTAPVDATAVEAQIASQDQVVTAPEEAPSTTTQDVVVTTVDVTPAQVETTSVEAQVASQDQVVTAPEEVPSTTTQDVVVTTVDVTPAQVETAPVVETTTAATDATPATEESSVVAPVTEAESTESNNEQK